MLTIFFWHFVTLVAVGVFGYCWGRSERVKVSREFLNIICRGQR